jgi:uncharacterized repeat protein (TIGR01451 family)
MPPPAEPEQQPPPGSMKGSETYYSQPSDAGWYRPGAAPAEPAPAAAKPAEPGKPAPSPTPRTASTGGVAIPTGDRSTSGLWIEKIAPAEAIQGQPFSYEIRATNLTNASLENVQVWDTIPSNFKIDHAEPTGKSSHDGLQWDLGTIDPRATKTIQVAGSASGSSPIQSCLGGTYNLGYCSTINVVLPALKLSQSTPVEATMCDPIAVRLTVTNTGSGSARNVHITDSLPAGLKTADGKTALDFDAGTLAAGQSRDFTFSAHADKAGTYQNSASAAAEGGLKADANSVSTKITKPVLSVSQRGPEKLFLGRPATYQITVTNTGDSPAANTTIEDPIPTGAAFASATEGGRLAGSTVMWNVGTLAPKDSKTVSVTLTLASIGSFQNRATAKANCADAVSATAGTEMAGIPALLLDGFDDPDPVQVGENVVYTLNITNQGSAPLTNVKLVCTMDDGDTMQYISSTGAGSGNASGKSINFAPLAKLDPKAKATYKVTIKALKEGQVQFRAEASSDQITRPLVKVETTNFYK